MSSPKLLYLDDEEPNLRVFSASFEDEYSIFVTTSAKEAARILRDEEIDVILTDQRMPRMTGVQFLEAVREERPFASRMILTGFSDVEAIIQAINTGRVDHYISKPWDYRELKTTLDRALEMQAQEKRNAELARQLESRIEEERRIREAFRKYVPEAVVLDALASRSERRLPGEARVVAVMFATLNGFRELTRPLSPRETVLCLNDYFSRMNAAIEAHHGIVGELVAEGIVAIFGAPVSTLENEENAARAALAMLESLDAWNVDVAIPKLGASLTLGIGLNRGEVTAGNIGSTSAMKYGVIGDTVNVASRIQGKTSKTESEILVNDGFAALLEAVKTVPVGEVTLKGKAESVRLHRLVR